MSVKVRKMGAIRRMGEEALREGGGILDDIGQEIEGIYWEWKVLN